MATSSVAVNVAGKRPLSPSSSELLQHASNTLEVTPLGAGQEVGRSCCLLKFQGKTVMFDSGIHPGYSGHVSLPFFDHVDLATVDLCLVTHFHLDHCASLPYLITKTTFKGRVFMTHATKAVYRLMLTDFLKVSGRGDDALYDEKDLVASLERIETVDFHQEREVAGVRFWCYVAGHVLGACMFMVDIAGTRVLYTGDYSREEDRHLQAAVEACVVLEKRFADDVEPKLRWAREHDEWAQGIVANATAHMQQFAQLQQERQIVSTLLWRYKQNVRVE